MRIEGYKCLYTRAQQTKKFMQNYLKFNPVSAGSKVGFVSHSSFLKSMTATGMSPGDDEASLIGGSSMKNCEIFPYEQFKC